MRLVPSASIRPASPNTWRKFSSHQSSNQSFIQILMNALTWAMHWWHLVTNTSRTIGKLHSSFSLLTLHHYLLPTMVEIKKFWHHLLGASKTTSTKYLNIHKHTSYDWYGHNAWHMEYHHEPKPKHHKPKSQPKFLNF